MFQECALDWWDVFLDVNGMGWERVCIVFAELWRKNTKVVQGGGEQREQDLEAIDWALKL